MSIRGGRTYEQFADHRPRQRGDPFSRVLTDARKYVVPRTFTEPPAWHNSTLVDSVEDLSGELVRSMPGLVDEFVLRVRPVALGTGREFLRGRTARSAAGRRGDGGYRRGDCHLYVKTVVNGMVA